MRQYLFWCSTINHYDDWFVQAGSSIEAKAYYEKIYGYDTEEVKTRLLVSIPQQLIIKKTSPPSNHKLKRLGIEFLREDEPRVARYQGKIYFEGIEIEKIDFCNGYKIYLFGVIGQNQYKLGHTTSIKRRVKEVLGNSPFQIEVIHYITTPAAKIVEEEIRTLFSKFISAKEWIMLDEWGLSILMVVFELYRIEFTYKKPNHKPCHYFNAIKLELIYIISVSKYNIKPKKEIQIRLQSLKDLIAQLRFSSIKMKEPNEIAKEIILHKKLVAGLENDLLNDHCIWKNGHLASDKYGSKFIIQQVEAHAFEDEKLDVSARFLFRARKILKNGEHSKTLYYLRLDDLLPINDKLI